LEERPVKSRQYLIRIYSIPWPSVRQVNHTWIKWATTRLFLSFKAIKEMDRGSCLSKIKQLIRNSYTMSSYVLDTSALLAYIENEDGADEV
jgi:hypothetical protein